MIIRVCAAVEIDVSCSLMDREVSTNVHNTPSIIYFIRCSSSAMDSTLKLTVFNFSTSLTASENKRRSCTARATFCLSFGLSKLAVLWLELFGTRSMIFFTSCFVSITLPTLKLPLMRNVRSRLEICLQSKLVVS